MSACFVYRNLKMLNKSIIQYGSKSLPIISSIKLNYNSKQLYHGGRHFKKLYRGGAGNDATGGAQGVKPWLWWSLSEAPQPMGPALSVPTMEPVRKTIQRDAPMYQDYEALCNDKIPPR